MAGVNYLGFTKWERDRLRAATGERSWAAVVRAAGAIVSVSTPQLNKRQKAEPQRTAALTAVLRQLVNERVLLREPGAIAAAARRHSSEENELRFGLATGDLPAVLEAHADLRRRYPVGDAAVVLEVLGGRPATSASDWERFTGVLGTLLALSAASLTVRRSEIPQSLGVAGDLAVVPLNVAVARFATRPRSSKAEREWLVEQLHPDVAELVRRVGYRAVPLLLHATPFAVALAAAHRREWAGRSYTALLNFMRHANRLGALLGSPAGGGITATPEALQVLVTQAALDVVADAAEQHARNLAGGRTDRQAVAAANKVAYSGFGTLNDALHGAGAAAAGLHCTGSLHRTTPHVRAEAPLYFPDEAMPGVKEIAELISAMFAQCADIADARSVAVGAATVGRGAESEPWRSEVMEHIGGALVVAQPEGVMKTGSDVAVAFACMVEAVGLHVGCFPDRTGVHGDEEARAARDRLAAVVERTNAWLVAQGRPPVPGQFGTGHALRHMVALVPNQTAPSTAGVAVTEMLNHAADGPNADGSYDLVSWSRYAELLAAHAAQLNAWCALDRVEPSVTKLFEVDASAPTWTHLPLSVVPIARLVFAEQRLEGLWELITGPMPTWQACVESEIVEVDGRRAVQRRGSRNAHRLTDGSLDLVATFLDRLATEPRLADANRVGRYVGGELNSRVLARCADYGIIASGQMLNVRTLRHLGASAVEALDPSAAERRALLGHSSVWPTPHVPHSPPVVDLVEQALAPLAAAVTAAIAANPAAAAWVDALRREGKEP